ncbi:MAG: hypothetical protein Q4B65_00575 [Candidatus Saccharibacteria bacterium]|nr:hypothetical protein [Candidatus Saccharibacteria bacterium]
MKSPESPAPNNSDNPNDSSFSFETDWESWEEPDPSKKLKEADPELYSRLEKLATEQEIDLSEYRFRDFKEELSRNPERLKEGFDDDALNALLLVHSFIKKRPSSGYRRGGSLETIIKKDSETLKSLLDGVDTIVAPFESEMDSFSPAQHADLEGVVEFYARNYDPKIITPETNEEIIKYTKQAFSTGDSAIFEDLNAALEVATRSGSADGLAPFIEYESALRKDPENQINITLNKEGIVNRYFRLHNIDPARVEAFDEILWPLLEKNDPEVEILQSPTNSYGMDYGDFGIADYTIHCFVSKVNPKNTNELLQAYREIPTSDFHKFEQNRLDALAISNVIIMGRDFIHDERPGVHELLSAMLDYYDSRENEEEHAKKETALRETLERLQSGPDGGYIYNYYTGIENKCFDLENYETEVPKRGQGTRSFAGLDGTERAIDVLRRLVENTRQDSLEKPITSDPNLNDALSKINPMPSSRTGEVFVDWGEAGNLVSAANKHLLARQNETGLRPSSVQAIAYTERIATYALRGIDRKDWSELPYDPNFKEMVKFQLLTGSDQPFNEQEFNRFYDRVVREIGPDYEDPKNTTEAYHKISAKILSGLNGLARAYNASPNTARRTGQLWSGNLAHEFLALADPDRLK